MAETKKTDRVFWLDAARAFAIISISMNHAYNRAFEGSGGAFALSLLKAFLQISSRLGVPLFLMITGVLLLDRDYTDRSISERFYRHNWLSLFITAEIWFLIMFLYKSAAPGSILRTQGIGAFLLQILSNALFINQDSFASMWYMTMILCVYLLIPAIALAIRFIRGRLLLIPLSVAVLSAFFFPNLNSVVSLISGGSGPHLEFALSIANLFSIYVVYIVIGYWIGKGGLSRMKKGLLLLCTAAAFAATVAYQLYAFLRPGGYVIKYHSIAVLLSSALLFECFRRCGCPPEKPRAAVTALSTISFGVYFVHICIMSGPVYIVPKSIGPLPYFLVLELVSLIGSILIILPLRRFKRLSRLLFRI